MVAPIGTRVIWMWRMELWHGSQRCIPKAFVKVFNIGGAKGGMKWKRWWYYGSLLGFNGLGWTNLALEWKPQDTLSKLHNNHKSNWWHFYISLSTTWGKLPSKIKTSWYFISLFKMLFEVVPSSHIYMYNTWWSF